MRRTGETRQRDLRSERPHDGPRSTLACRREDRRKKLVGNPDWNGLDFLEVADDQLSLCVHFFGQVPDGVDRRATCASTAVGAFATSSVP